VRHACKAAKSDVPWNKMTLVEKLDFMQVKVAKNARRIKCMTFFFAAFSVMFALNFAYSFYKAKDWAHYIAVTGKGPWKANDQEMRAAQHAKMQDA